MTKKFAFLSFLQLADLITTKITINLGAEELNLFTKHLVENGEWGPLILIKLIFLSLVSILLLLTFLSRKYCEEETHEKIRKAVSRYLDCLVLIFLVVVINNLLQLLLFKLY